MNAWYCPLRTPVPVNIRLSPFTLSGSLFNPSVAGTTVTTPLVPPIAPTGGGAAWTAAVIVVLPAPVTPSVALEELLALSAIATVAPAVFPGWNASTAGLLLVSPTDRGEAARRLPTPGVVRKTMNPFGGDSVLRNVSRPEIRSCVGFTCTWASLEVKPPAGTVAVRRTPSAGPPSPEKPAGPVPTRVRMTPVAASTLRTRCREESAISRSLPGRTMTWRGLHRRARVAACPSPLKPQPPVPATVVITSSASPVMPGAEPAATRRTRWLPRSAKYRRPEASKAMRQGSLICAAEAGPPSPAKPGTVPATEVMVSPAASAPALTRPSAPGATRLMRCVLESAMYSAPSDPRPTPSGLHKDAEVAGPPSPARAHDPLPATVVMVSLAASGPAAIRPSLPGSTRRTRLKL